MKLTRFPQQIEGANLTKEHGSYVLFMEPRTGKSLTVLDGVSALNAEPVLIICPANVIPSWENTLLEDEVDPKYICKIHKRGKSIKKIKNLLLSQTPKYFIINFEKVKEADALNIRRRILPGLSIPNWKAIIVDESYRISNQESQITDYLLRYSKPKDQFRYCLTGTPGLPVNYVTQFLFTYGEYFGCKTSGEYFAKYWNYDTDRYLWTVKDKQHLEDIKKYVQEHAYCVTMKQLGLGCEIFYSLHRIETNNAQNELLHWVRNANFYYPRDSKKKKLLIPAVRTLYERMISAGIDPRTHEIISEWKINHVIETYEVDRKPLVVVSFFKPILIRLKERLEKKGYSCGFIVGGMGEAVVEGVRKDFQAGVFDIVVSQIGPIKEGKDFSRLDKLIHISNSLSQNDTVQVRKRGQNLNRTKPYEVIDLVSEDTVEIRLSQMLRSKQRITESFMKQKLNEEILNRGVVNVNT